MEIFGKMGGGGGGGGGRENPFATEKSKGTNHLSLIVITCRAMQFQSAGLFWREHRSEKKCTGEDVVQT